MKTKASIKSNAFVSKFRPRLGRNISWVRFFVSATKKNIIPVAGKNQIDEKHRSSLLHEEPVVLRAKGQWRIKKLESSITGGFDSIVTTYSKFFGVGQKTQQNKCKRELQMQKNGK